MHPYREAVLAETRRQFFGRVTKGVGGLALANLLAEDALGMTQADESFAAYPFCLTSPQRRSSVSTST